MLESIVFAILGYFWHEFSCILIKDRVLDTLLNLSVKERDMIEEELDMDINIVETISKETSF